MYMYLLCAWSGIKECRDDRHVQLGVYTCCVDSVCEWNSGGGEDHKAVVGSGQGVLH